MDVVDLGDRVPDSGTDGLTCVALCAQVFGFRGVAAVLGILDLTGEGVEALLELSLRGVLTDSHPRHRHRFRRPQQATR